MARTHRGSWADTPTGAVAVALDEVNVSVGDYVECFYADGSVAYKPIDPDGEWEVHADVSYSESRDQYRAHLRRTPTSEREKMSEQTIELDCPPGSPRPGDLIGGVIEGTGLPERETVARVFGEWVWDYSDVSPEEWKAIQPTLKERIEKLYNQGLIRWGSW